MKGKLSPRGAVWLGLLGTPILIIAIVVAIGVVAAPAGPTKASAPNAQAATSQVVGSPVSVSSASAGAKTTAELVAYWTSARMADANPYPMPTLSGSSAQAGPAPQASGPAKLVAGSPPGGTQAQSATTISSAAASPLTECYQCAIPFTRESLQGGYRRYPMYTVAKMFFSQDHDANGTASNFVCSASTIGVDGIWTAGHCITNGLNGTGFASGVSFNILICPSYDSAQGGVNPAVGCWGVSSLTVWSTWYVTGNLNYDFGGASGTSGAIAPASGMIGNTTGSLGLAWNWNNVHWWSLGYPQGAPFNGGKIITCQSSLGYYDNSGQGGTNDPTMGCDMTGGSSGGPWVMEWGFPGQVGGLGGNYLNGHNDWRFGGLPNSMNSPYFDCRAIDMYNAINGTAFTC